jgi:nucleoside-diphosphate-sugar epimerase
MIIITGHTGFIGKNFIKKFKQKNIILLKRNITNIKNIKNKKIKVLNFATKYIKNHKYKNIKEIINANLIYPISIIETLSKNNNISFFNFCSYFQYKNNKTNRINLYSSSKEALSPFLKYYEIKSKIKVFNIIIYDTFGPSDKRHKIFNEINMHIKNNKSLVIREKNYYMAPIYIDDLIDLLIKYIKDKKRPKEIHCHQQKIISIGSICALAKKLYPGLNIKYGKNNKVSRIYVKKNNFYWKPKISLKERMKYFFTNNV